MKYNCIIILGPTASGKTKLSIELAKQLNGEIINADSQQIIKGLNIGTAKITEQEKGGIPHHLFDIINVGQDFSVSEYQKLATKKFDEILSLNKLPIIVGGTGFYINSLIYNYSFGNSNKDNEIRAHYENLAKQHGNEYVYNILKDLDPESSVSLHPNDLKRVIRAIEIFKASGEKKSAQQLTKNPNIKPYIIGLNLDRKLLYNRINNRVDIMIQNGLESEIKDLEEQGFYSPISKVQLPIGYSEWNDFINNSKTKEEVIDKIKQNSRHYAKRQMTWFRRVEDVKWYDINNSNSDFNNIIDDTIKAFSK